MLRRKITDRSYLKELIEIYNLLMKPAKVTIYIRLTGLIVSLIIYLPHVILNKKCHIIIFTGHRMWFHGSQLFQYRTVRY